MRKALRIIALSSGIISIVSMVVLCFIYLEDLTGHLNIFKNKLFKKLSERNRLKEESDLIQ